MGNGERRTGKTNRDTLGGRGCRLLPFPAPRSPFPRLRAWTLALSLAAAACGEEPAEIPTLKRISLPEPVTAAATLAVDERGRVWVGERDRLVVMDTLGRVAARFPLPGAPARVLHMHGTRVYLSRGPRDLAVLDAATGKVVAQRRARRTAPVAVDPRGRWAFTAGPLGGVLGLDTLLVTRWGWPEAGSTAGALAVSPLGDRVYLALEGDDERDLAPALQVRDAFSGRILSTWEAPAPVRGLEPSADGRLFGWDDDGVFALRHTPAGLEEVWRVSSGLERVDAVRASPSGANLAVLARGEGGGVRVLDAADGRVIAGEGEAPPDAAWDVRGRLLVLGTREVRVVR